MKRIFSALLALIVVLSAMVVMPVTASATSTSIAKKSASPLDEEGRFEVEIQVPGEDGREYHDEVIVMVDGSYSTDDDWGTTRSAILEIGKTVLEGSGNTLLTVMTFGMGDNIVLKHVASVSELDATLTQLPGGLLYGRSSTNCEAGFTGISEYIASHDSSLNEVHVVYISDGEINTDESEYVFYNWTQNTWLKRDAVTIATWAIEEEYALYEAGQTRLSNAYLTVFGDPSLEVAAIDETDETLPGEETEPDETTSEEENTADETTDETASSEETTVEGATTEGETTADETSSEEETEPDEPTSEEELKTDGTISAEQLSSNGNYKVVLLSNYEVNSVSDTTGEEEATFEEKVMAWADQVWKDVYAYSGMTPETAYTVSDAERAFVRYDKENGTHVQEMFYYSLWGRSYPERYTRTPAAGLALAANGKVAHLYLVDSNSATSWMSGMASAASNISFYEAGSVSNLLATLEGVLTNLAYTPYNDVVVTDYMSKWVNLDTTTIKVVDNNSGTTIWTSTDGWLISGNRPTSQESPVVVEEVPSDKYEEGGQNVVGNESGTIYKLTWYVKDNAMLRNHNYSLVYEVDVDTQETGFKYDTDYPANGNTTIEYTEKEGDEITPVKEEIPVPDVIVTEPEPPTTEATEPETEPPTTETTEPETEPTESETIDIKVTKTWKDQNDKYGKRPSKITINLMANGTKVASRVITEKDNWQGVFKNMPKYDSEGNKIVYTVSENKVANYTTVVNGYNIVNTYKKTIFRPFNSDEMSPRTGDYIFIAVIVAVVSGGLLIVLAKKRTKRNK